MSGFTAQRLLLRPAALAAAAAVAVPVARRRDSDPCGLWFCRGAAFCDQRRPVQCQGPVPPSASPARQRRVCCIGAGAAGLACAKDMIERGFETTVFEIREGMGGVWRLDRTGRHVGVRLEQKATSSKYYLGFSDYPIPDAAPDFPSHEQYIAYLEDYARHFNVHERIRYSHRVVDVRKLRDGTWEVDVVAGGRKGTHVFDAIAVCSGLHSVPDFPPRGVPPPPAGFQARVIHAVELKDVRSAMSGKRIVVGGGGETGVEMAHLAAVEGVAPALFSLRRGITVIGSYLPLPLAGRMPDARTPPVDLNERRVLTLLPHLVKHYVFTRDPQTVFGLRDENPGRHSLMRLLDTSVVTFATVAVAPFFMLGGLAQHVFQELTHPLFWTFDKQSFRQPNGPAMSQAMKVATSSPAVPPLRQERDTKQLMDYTRRAVEYRMQGYTLRHYQQIRSLLEEYSGARHTQNFLTKSDDFIYNLMDHSLELRPGIKGYEGTNTVIFEDESKTEADLVVWCTGYQPQVPFLQHLLPASSPDGRDRFDGTALFKNVFNPEIGESLAFIGFARPQLGAMPPIAELQARWFGAVLSGQAELPSKDTMEAEIITDRVQYENKVFAERMRSTVDFGRYTADIAKRAGCYPDVGMRTFFQDFSLWQAFWFGPVLPQSYRLDDGGGRGEAARARLKMTYQTFFTRS